jgi:hypothetical protein
MRTHWRTIVGRLAITIPLLLIGCGRGDQPELGSVFGIVSLNGKPLTHVEVTFAPEVGRPSYGETNDEGIYELVYLRDVKGAKVGRHAVTIHSTKVDNSLLKPVEVKPGNNLIDIECPPKAKKDAGQVGGDDQ